MPRFRDSKRRRASGRTAAARPGLRFALLACAAALLPLLLPASVWAAWTTNLVELDNGTCGRNLQIGSDRNASTTATPTFFLRGDGGLSSYVMAIDGRPIGTFYSSGSAIVCVTTATPLADGPHLLTGTELAPHPAYVATPLSFSVDTVPPAPPSRPVLSAYSDSGDLGDGITKYRSVNLTGSAEPYEPVQISSGATVIGGARSDATGHWSATTENLLDGAYVLTATALDSAGNRSLPSPSTRVTIDSAPPATPTAPTLAEPGIVTGLAAGDVASIHVFADGIELGAAVAGRKRMWRFALPPLAPGAHTIVVAGADTAGNVTALSASLSVTIDAPPEPSTPGPPAPEDPAPAPVNEARPLLPEPPPRPGPRPPRP